jgi:putative endonuclease
MTDHNRKIGKWGEEEATRYLKEKDYQILFNNWRAERGDIDIIAIDKDCLVFVEVKGGFSEKYGPPELRVTKNKQMQLKKLASIFLSGDEVKEIDFEICRFDVVIIDGHQNKFDIRHYENAFYL